MKIIATISDFGAAANIGGEIERYSYVIDIPDDKIPVPVLLHFKDKEIQKWQTMALSVFKENTDEKSI